jgi:hypothetical protein
VIPSDDHLTIGFVSSLPVTTNRFKGPYGTPGGTNAVSFKYVAYVTPSPLGKGPVV